MPAARGAGHGAIDDLARETAPRALRALPGRQLEAVVLHACAGLSEQQAAAAMGISIGAARAHLAGGMASLSAPTPAGIIPADR
jgi:DNA-directed RNA polymerase specialized sigma24 family protein